MDVFPEGHVHAGGGTSGRRCRQRWHGPPKIPPGDGLPQSRRPETRPPDIRNGIKDGSEAARGAIGPPALRDHAELRDGCTSRNRRVGDVAGPATSAAVASWRMRRLLRSLDVAIPSAAHQADALRCPERPAYAHPPGAVYRR